MGVRKVGPPKISSSRQVEEENPQGRADDRKNLVCRKAHKILRAGGARNVEKGRPHSGGVRQPSSRRKRQCGFINTKNPGFVVSHKAVFSSVQFSRLYFQRLPGLLVPVQFWA